MLIHDIANLLSVLIFYTLKYLSVKLNYTAMVTKPEVEFLELFNEYLTNSIHYNNG